MGTKKSAGQWWRDLLDHPRAEISHVVKPVIIIDDTGKPIAKIETLAKIVQVWTKGTYWSLRLAVLSWDEDGNARHHYGSATGCGYDKRAAALCGAIIDGVELGDHCDGRGRPTLRDAAHAHGWKIFGCNLGA